MANQNEISKYRKYYDQKTLREAGFSYYKVNQFVLADKLRKINKGNYENLTYEGEENDFYHVNAFIEKGVICLMSAAVYYGFSNHRTMQVDVAIPHKAKAPTLPPWPKIKLYYFAKNRYEFAVDTIFEGENRFKIYDMEKTVCDLILYRNKFGQEDAIEVLKNYLKNSQSDLNKLVDYAKKLKCYALISKYLEVLI